MIKVRQLTCEFSSVSSFSNVLIGKLQNNVAMQDFQEYICF